MRPALPTPPAPPPPPVRPARHAEITIARLAIWLGAIALALAGAFLVKYSVDRGWIGPGTRVALALAFGLALVGAGEWLRRRAAAIAQGCVAAGVAVVFAALYAAVDLYRLIGPAAGFVALALAAVGAIALSLRHGPAVALLGLVGGFLTPMWVGGREPRPGLLFGYLFLLQTALAVVSRRRSWWPIGLLTTLGGAVWVLGWIGLVHRGAVGTTGAGIYLVATTAMLVLIASRGAEREDGPIARRLRLAWTWSAAALGLLLAGALVRAAGFSPFDWLFFAAIVLGCLALGRIDERNEPLGWLAAAASAAFLWAWAIGIEHAETLAGEPRRFLLTVLAFGVMIGGAAFAALWGAKAPSRWGALTALAAVGGVLVGRVGTEAIAAPPRWGLIGALVAGALAALATLVVRARRDDGALDGAATALAAASAALVALAAADGLDRFAIGAVWAIEIPILLWLARHPALARLAHGALPLAALVALRLVVNPFVLDYPIRGILVANDLAWGYGVPLLCMTGGVALSLRAGARRRGEGLAAVAILVAFAWITLVVRHGFHAAPMGRGELELAELGSYTMAWLTLAIGLVAVARATDLTPLRLAAPGLGLFAVSIALAAQGAIANPIHTGASVGATPVLNLLVAVYGLPALLAAILASWLARRGDRIASTALGAGALALVFLLVSLEVRQAFRGAVLSGPRSSEAELYAYSLAWILLAVALLVAGVLARNRVLAYGSAAVMLVAVAKVFLVDTASLGGLFRVLSLLGLGISLMVLAWVYQRFVFRALRR